MVIVMVMVMDDGFDAVRVDRRIEVGDVQAGRQVDSVCVWMFHSEEECLQLTHFVSVGR